MNEARAVSTCTDINDIGFYAVKVGPNKNGGRTNRKKARLKCLVVDWGISKILEETAKKPTFALRYHDSLRSPHKIGRGLQQHHDLPRHPPLAVGFSARSRSLFWHGRQLRSFW